MNFVHLTHCMVRKEAISMETIVKTHLNYTWLIVMQWNEMERMEFFALILHEISEHAKKRESVYDHHLEGKRIAIDSHINKDGTSWSYDVDTWTAWMLRYSQNLIFT